MATISRWGIRDGMRLARTVGKHLHDPSRYTTQEFIEAAEIAALESPNEWVIYFSLGDKYMSIGQHARALQACKRCVEIRPNDIRSAYALATAYNMLTRADWATIKPEIEIFIQLFHPPPEAGPFDPDVSKSETEEMGMVVDTAAAQAIRWFESAIEMNPDRDSRGQIQQDLQVLYQRYPHLRA